MQRIRITKRTLIGGKMREVGEELEVYPWQARRLSHQGQAEDVEPEEQGELAEAYGPDVALTLKDAGYSSVSEVQAADGEELLAVNGIGKATLRKIRDV